MTTKAKTKRRATPKPIPGWQAAQSFSDLPVGQHVRFSRCGVSRENAPSIPRHGAPGRVVAISGARLGVEFERAFEYGHNCNGAVADERGRYFWNSEDASYGSGLSNLLVPVSKRARAAKRRKP